MEVKNKTVPAFAEVKYSYPSTRKESNLKYTDIEDKVDKLLDHLRNDAKTRAWVEKAKELGVSWKRVYIFFISVWSYSPDIKDDIEMLDDDKIIDRKSVV